MSESPWVLDRSKLPAEQFTWSSTTLGPAAGAPKAGAMRKVGCMERAAGAPAAPAAAGAGLSAAAQLEGGEGSEQQHVLGDRTSWVSAVCQQTLKQC
jgi:hypothetical protein